MSKSYAATLINDLSDKYAHVAFTIHDSFDNSFNSIKLLIISDLDQVLEDYPIPEEMLSKYPVLLDLDISHNGFDPFSPTYSYFVDTKGIKLDSTSQEFLHEFIENEGIHLYKAISEKDPESGPYVEINLLCGSGDDETNINRSVQGKNTFIDIVLRGNYAPYINTTEHPPYIISTESDEDAMDTLNALADRQHKLVSDYIISERTQG